MASAASLEEGEQSGKRPTVRIDDGMGAGRKDARDVFQKPAARDVGERADLSLADDRKEASYIDAGRLQ